MSQSAGSKHKRTDSAAGTVGESRHFDAAALGASFQQLAVDVVRGESTDFMSRWFRTPKSDADLVIWTDSEKRIIKHQLCFFGQVVEWNPINGTRTGLVIEEELAVAEEKPEPAKSSKQKAEPAAESGDIAEIIRFDKVAQAPVVEQALKLLAHIPDLVPEDRAALSYNLRESPKLHKKARERALKTWAPKVDEIVSTQRPTFWRRLRSWVLGD